MKAQPARRRSALNGWLLLAVLPFCVCSGWLLVRDDAPEEPRSAERSSPAPQTETAAPPPVVVLEAPDAAVVAVVATPEPLDAGLPDAGGEKRLAHDEPTAREVEAYIARWKAALAPVFKASRAMEPKAVLSEPDGGVAPKRACTAGEHTLPFITNAMVDVVVAVDTSGSMRPVGLDVAADFLGKLEWQLTHDQVDYRLVVLAEPRALKLSTDAGVSTASVQSHDGLEVLIRTARDASPFWLQLVREGAERRLVLVTDDRPDPAARAEVFVQALEQVVPRPFTFSVVGGFHAVGAALAPSALLAVDRCAGTFGAWPVRGLNAGLVYQQVAIALGGARASLCNEDSRLDLVAQLARPPEKSAQCQWSLGAGATPRSVRAAGLNGSVFLVREPLAANCAGLRNSFVSDRSTLTLCPETCAELQLRRTTELVVSVECD